jgi:hypothetical protein
LKKPHPLAGVTFTIDKNKLPKIFSCKETSSKETIYYVGTNDYLSNGGDNMNFFKRSSKICFNTN